MDGSAVRRRAREGVVEEEAPDLVELVGHGVVQGVGADVAPRQVEPEPPVGARAPVTSKTRAPTSRPARVDSTLALAMSAATSPRSRRVRAGPRS